jgi:hypothetical protein
MDRIQTVNGGQDTLHPFGPPDLRPPLDGSEDREAEEGLSERSGSLAATGQFGVCLYLGPRGQRCGKAALANGFCASHKTSLVAQVAAASTQDQAEPNPAKDRTRAFAAILGLIGVLWPVISEVARAIISFLHQK